MKLKTILISLIALSTLGACAESLSSNAPEGLARRGPPEPSRFEVRPVSGPDRPGRLEPTSRVDVGFAHPSASLEVEAQLFPSRWSGERSVDEPDRLIRGSIPGDRAGFGVASGGDLNDDGLDELAIAVDARIDESYAARIALFYDVPELDLIDRASTWFVEGRDGWVFLPTVSLDGDLNADGLDDLVIGIGHPELREVGACIFYGEPHRLEGSLRTTDCDARVVGSPVGGGLEVWLITRGDYDPDGYADLVIASPYDDTQGEDAGAVYVVRGQIAGTVDLREPSGDVFAWFGEDEADELGWRITALDDADGDRAEELLLAESYRPTGVYRLRHWTSEEVLDATDTDCLGPLVNVGDVDGDSAPDLGLGCPTTGDPGGTLRLVHAPFSVAPRLSVLPIGGGSSGFGMRALGVGDLDVDGASDVVIADPALSVNADHSGGLFVAYGTPTTLESPEETFAFDVPSWISGSQTYDLLGYRMATGDIDGDGVDDVILGLPFRDSDVIDTGIVAVFSGRP